MIPDASPIINSKLDAGERLLWSGQPRTGIRFRPQDLILIPFSLLWGGFAIFWEVTALTVTSNAQGPVAVIFPLFGLPFVSVGLYLIAGRFFVDARGRARTYYGVTDRRVLIVSGLFSQQTKSLQLRTISDVTLSERSDGSGSITFGATHPMAGFFPAGGWPGSRGYLPPAFDMIEDSKRVYDTIRQAQNT